MRKRDHSRRPGVRWEDGGGRLGDDADASGNGRRCGRPRGKGASGDYAGRFPRRDRDRGSRKPAYVSSRGPLWDSSGKASIVQDARKSHHARIRRERPNRLRGPDRDGHPLRGRYRRTHPRRRPDRLDLGSSRSLAINRVPDPSQSHPADGPHLNHRACRAWGQAAPDNLDDCRFFSAADQNPCFGWPRNAAPLTGSSLPQSPS